MGNSNLKRAFFSPNVFGLVIGLLVFLVFMFIGIILEGFKNLEIQLMDLHFKLKNTWQVQERGAGFTDEIKSAKLSNDIVVIGVDNRTLEQFGRWPFPRRIHADLLNSFTRIKQQEQRESVVLLDFLFNEISERAFEDVIFLESIKSNNRVALQTLHAKVEIATTNREELINRFQVLIEEHGEIKNIQGDLSKVNANYGIESPLRPYGEAISTFGHASYGADDDEVYRRQQLVSRYSVLAKEIPLDTLTIDTELGIQERGHIAWENMDGIIETVDLPLTTEKIENLRRDISRQGLKRRTGGADEGTYYIRSYEDHFIPAITLTLALKYFNKTFDDLEVVYGSHILIPSPMRWDTASGKWVQYEFSKNSVNGLQIPIDESGNMMINFMGGKSSTNPGEHQTFPVRSYARFARNAPDLNTENWPNTNGLGGKIVMVGAFTIGMADDEKPTPMGLMFGVEMHANALNTIIMNNFIYQLPKQVNALILLVLTMLFAFLISRMKGIGWSIAFLIGYLIISFLAVTILFDSLGLLIDWVTPTTAVFITFIAVVIFRGLMAERDKRQIKSVFGQFIAAELVDELVVAPPELGGDYVDGTVMFTDIRGFSNLSERLAAQQLVDFLNEYLTLMTDNIVNAYGGTLDKYIGDAIMAFWGAPKAQEDHALRACKSAIAQVRILSKFNPIFKEKYGNAVNIGIGINPGSKRNESLMVSYMGSEGRKNYTAMGDSVNLASRLEGVNKEYRTTIIISEDVYKLISSNDDRFVVRELDDIRVKGRNKPVTIFELVDYEGELKGV